MYDKENEMSTQVDASDWNPVSEVTNIPQSLTPLVELNLQDICLTVLSWMRGHNLHNPGDPKKLTYGMEVGEGYTAFEFRMHGDMVALRTVGSSTYHMAKVIYFGDVSKVRVRFMKWRQVQDHSGNIGSSKIKQLLDMLELDYNVDTLIGGVPGLKRAGTDIYNHIGAGVFDFDFYREHYVQEPPILSGTKPTKRLYYKPSY